MDISNLLRPALDAGRRRLLLSRKIHDIHRDCSLVRQNARNAATNGIRFFVDRFVMHWGVAGPKQFNLIKVKLLLCSYSCQKTNEFLISVSQQTFQWKTVWANCRLIEIVEIGSPSSRHQFLGLRLAANSSKSATVEGDGNGVQSLNMIGRNSRPASGHKGEENSFLHSEFGATAFDPFLSLNREDRANECGSDRQPLTGANSLFDVLHFGILYKKGTLA
jgi:hypothetical protein